MFGNRLDENRMLHAEAFIGRENIEKIRRVNILVR